MEQEFKTSDLRTVAIKHRFLKNVKKTETCWLWTWTLTRGYGVFRKGKDMPTTSAHRISYELFCGKIPKNYEVHHLCRVRQCVNPDHLEIVSRKEHAKKRIGIKQIPKIESAYMININWKEMQKELLSV